MVREFPIKVIWPFLDEIPLEAPSNVKEIVAEFLGLLGIGFNSKNTHSPVGIEISRFYPAAKIKRMGLS